MVLQDLATSCHGHHLNQKPQVTKIKDHRFLLITVTSSSECDASVWQISINYIHSMSSVWQISINYIHSMSLEDS